MPERLKLLAWLALVPLALAPPLQAQTSAPTAAVTNPVRVGDLLDLPILDESRSVMGRVRGVVKTGDGKIQLLLPIGGLLGFGERLVAIPIENTVLTGPQVMVLEVPPDRFQKSATWYGSNSETLAATETIPIGRR
jgi:hypothetical protein